MLSAEEIILLTSHLGNPQRCPLTPAQFRTLAEWAAYTGMPLRSALSSPAAALGSALTQKIFRLLEDTEPLRHYLRRAERLDCLPITVADAAYPQLLRSHMGSESTACLWALGNTDLLAKPCVSLVGSRDIFPQNREFARHVGMQAAEQGYVLVSGNARGADREGQNACLAAGGSIICVVADGLYSLHPAERILYLSETDYDAEFSAWRALHRNRVIHAMSHVTFVAQCTFKKGGTWSGSEINLRHGFSALCCFRDGSAASAALEQMGAQLIGMDSLSDFSVFRPGSTLFDLAER